MSPILGACPAPSVDLAHGPRTPPNAILGHGSLFAMGDMGGEERERLALILRARGEIAAILDEWDGAPAGDRTRMPEGAGF